MLDVTTGKWQSFTSANGLSDDFLKSVAVAEDGSIWFAGEQIISRLVWPDRPAGTPTWSNYPYEVENIEHGPHDTLWFAGFTGIQFFDPRSNTIQNYSAELSNAGFSVTPQSLAFGSDGSLWIGSGTSNEIFHLVTDENSHQMSLRSYDSRDGLPKPLSQDGKVAAIAFAPNGSL